MLFWRMRRKAVIGMVIGATLGCLVGAITEFRPPPSDVQKPYVVSVNQDTGKPQLHVQGKPDPK
jgi:hypothetical protein